MSNVGKLLLEKPESYYWIGFLLSDGYYCRSKKEIVLTLSSKDKSHISKYGLYVGSNKIYKFKIKNKYNCVRVVINGRLINNILKKFDWKNRKTYNPPSIRILRKIGIKKSLYLFAGIIDADGCIQYQHKRKDCKISIHTHSSWYKVFNYYQKIIDKYFGYKTSPPKILKSGYLRYDICNIRLISDIKKFVIKSKLPVMDRKWNKIDLKRKHKHDVANNICKKICNLRKRGFTYKKISQKLKISFYKVTYHVRKGKISKTN